jgi:hypothetical protein
VRCDTSPAGVGSVGGGRSLCAGWGECVQMLGSNASNLSRRRRRVYFDVRLPLRLSRDISPILDSLASFSFSRRASF